MPCSSERIHIHSEIWIVGWHIGSKRTRAALDVLHGKRGLNLLDVNAHSELSLRDLFVIYKRRRKIVYRVVGVVFLLAAIYCLFATRRYEATSTIQVQSKSVDNLGIQSMVNGSPEQEVDALSANINVQTQAEILQSD